MQLCRIVLFNHWHLSRFIFVEVCSIFAQTYFIYLLTIWQSLIADHCWERKIPRKLSYVNHVISQHIWDLKWKTSSFCEADLELYVSGVHNFFFYIIPKFKKDITPIFQVYITNIRLQKWIETIIRTYNLYRTNLSWSVLPKDGNFLGRDVDSELFFNKEILNHSKFLCQEFTSTIVHTLHKINN